MDATVVDVNGVQDVLGADGGKCVATPATRGAPGATAAASAGNKRPANSSYPDHRDAVLRSALAARAREVRANPQRRARYDIPAM